MVAPHVPDPFELLFIRTYLKTAADVDKVPETGVACRSGLQPAVNLLQVADLPYNWRQGTDLPYSSARLMPLFITHFITHLIG